MDLRVDAMASNFPERAVRVLGSAAIPLKTGRARSLHAVEGHAGSGNRPRIGF